MLKQKQLGVSVKEILVCDIGNMSATVIFQFVR